MIGRVTFEAGKSIFESNNRRRIISKLLWVHLFDFFAHHSCYHHDAMELVGQVLWILIIDLVVNVINAFFAELWLVSILLVLAFGKCTQVCYRIFIYLSPFLRWRWSADLTCWCWSTTCLLENWCVGIRYGVLRTGKWHAVIVLWI